MANNKKKPDDDYDHFALHIAHGLRQSGKSDRAIQQCLIQMQQLVWLLHLGHFDQGKAQNLHTVTFQPPE